MTFIGARGDGPSCQALGGSTAQFEGYVKSHSLRDRPTDRKLILCGQPPISDREKELSLIGGGIKREKESEGGLLRHKREFSGLPLALHSVSCVAVTADQNRHSVQEIFKIGLLNLRHFSFFFRGSQSIHTGPIRPIS